MAHNRLKEFREGNLWTQLDQGDEIIDRPSLGKSLVEEYNSNPSLFQYLQTLIAGKDSPLPNGRPYVRIVTAKDDWKEDFALVYGFPAISPSQNLEAKPIDAAESTVTTNATRFPNEAARFMVYYGANHVAAGALTRVLEVKPLEPEIASKLESGEFTDEEAEALLEANDELVAAYWNLNTVARDPELNPDYAERANEKFHRDAARGES